MRGRRKAAAPGAAAAAAAAGEAFYPFGFNYGIHFVTRTKVGDGGFQLTCNNPLHADESARCTKTQSATRVGGGMEGALRRLKVWVSLSSKADSEASHKAMLNDVEKAWKDNTVPTMKELDDMATINTSHEPLPHALADADGDAGTDDDEADADASAAGADTGAAGSGDAPPPPPPTDDPRPPKRRRMKQSELP